MQRIPPRQPRGHHAPTTPLLLVFIVFSLLGCGGREPTPAGTSLLDLMPLAEVEKIQLLHTLESVNGNKSKAARILGISRQTLREKLKSYLSEAAAEAAEEA